ncbi:Nitroreductase [Cylindrobasidium torrendii FP15055 ss-10]|uniref:Nitroreductase n=1 Tax=Cylindrobasidium torrendii FP15055 ss-10 TaxID=1314674 RepID=A0A0D7BRB8_9AGAR|nr:Nitroreductase [Cylindrobasidium torrendii FP15055 ss-10]
MSASAAFFDAVEARRTSYALTNKSTLSDSELQALVERAVKHAPSSFNSQSARVVIITGQKHRELWDTVFAGLKNTLGGNEQQENYYKEKFENSYKTGYGTILFYEDQAVVNTFITKFPTLAQAFPVFSQNSAGMLQYIVWTALAKEGLGASLQHYGAITPEIETAVTAGLGVPTTWKSTAMMPFGVPSAGPGEKTFQPLEERVKTIFSA